MFKDIYKAANDDIRPDPYLLGRILNKSKEKPKPFFYRHRIAVFAAVIALIIALPSVIKKPENTGSNVLEQKYLPKAQNDETYFILSNKTADNAEESAAKNTAADLSGEIAKDKESIDYTTADEMTVVMSVNSFSASPEAASFSGAFGGASSQPDVEELTSGQYFDMLGFSPDMLNIPEGLSPDFAQDTTVTISKQDGEILSDENTFTYSGENFLMLTTSTSNENALSYINSDQYEKSIFGDKNAVILYDGSVYEAHIVHSSGTALKFITDLPEEQLKNLLISAAQ